MITNYQMKISWKNLTISDEKWESSTYFKGQLLVDDHGWRENLASRKERPMVKMKE